MLLKVVDQDLGFSEIGIRNPEATKVNNFATEPSTHVETSALPANNDSSELDNSDELPAELEKTSRRLTSS